MTKEEKEKLLKDLQFSIDYWYRNGKMSIADYIKYQYEINKHKYVYCNPLLDMANGIRMWSLGIKTVYCPYCNKELDIKEWAHDEVNDLDICLYCNNEVDGW